MKKFDWRGQISHIARYPWKVWWKCYRCGTLNTTTSTAYLCAHCGKSSGFLREVET